MEQWPELVDPVLVYSFTGWVDAGLAGLGTLELFVEQIEESGGGRFGAIDLTDLLDLQQTAAHGPPRTGRRAADRVARGRAVVGSSRAAT